MIVLSYRRVSKRVDLIFCHLRFYRIHGAIDVLGGRREPGISAEDVIAQVDFDTPTGKRAAGCAASAGLF